MNRVRVAFSGRATGLLVIGLGLWRPAIVWAAEEAGVSELPPFLQPNPYLAFWTIVVFGGLLWVLGKFAWKPLLDALNAREQRMHQMISEAEQAREQAKSLLAEHDRKLAGVHNEVRAILDEARRDAQATHGDILRQAQAEAQSTRERAKREIEQARDQALKNLFDHAAELATQVASRIIGRNLKPEDSRDLVQQAVNELPSKN